MSKVSRILFLLIGSVFPILIGTLHTFVHFSNLVSPEIQLYLQKEFMYSGKLQALWPAWGIASFMMGLSFIVIGLLNISTFRRLSTTDYPPLLSILAMTIFLLGVVYVGYEFEQSFQLFGGLFGVVLSFVCLGISLKNRKPV